MFYFSTKKIIKTLLLLCLSCQIFAQNINEVLPAASHNCASDELHEQKMATNPFYRQAMEKAEQKITQAMADGAIYQKAVLTIPVVVHIMHLPDDAIGEGSNISDAQVSAGIQHLNDAFRNINFYAGDPQFSNSGVAAADVEIEFCMATRDPTGAASNGINRVSTSLSNLYRDDMIDGKTQDEALKELSYWNC